MKLTVTSSVILCLIASWNAAFTVQGFGLTPSTSTKIRSSHILSTGASGNLKRLKVSPLSVSISGGDEIVTGSLTTAVLTDEEVNPILKFGSGDDQKIVNVWGLWCVAVTLITCPFWYLAMKIIGAISESNEDFDPDRSLYDHTGKVWSKIWLFMANSYPEVTGDLDQIKKDNGACLYVANHASWLDIPIVCTVLHPVFKFISKGSLKSLPCIGDQLVGGHHILIDREDRRSQLRTFKEGINWLKKGVSLMAFPEGARSPDGRLMKFKGGAFSMAVRQKVPIVPITIVNAHATMPANAIFPIQSGAGKLAVHVHPAISVEGKSEEELENLVRTAIMSKLPADQLPLPEVSEEDTSVVSAKKDSAAGNAKELQSSP